MADLTIKDVRAKFPQYSDLTDTQLADALHGKYYSDVPKDQFYGKIGLAGAEAASLQETAGFGSKDQPLAPIEAPQLPWQQPVAGAPTSAPDARPVMPPLPGQPQAPVSNPDQALIEAMTSTPPPPVRPRSADPLPTFGMMGGTSRDQGDWAKREVQRLEQEMTPEERAAAAKPTQPAGFTPKPETYTPLGEAILTELGNTPERLQRGFKGNTLLEAERGIHVNLTDIGAIKRGSSELADVEAQLATMKAEMDANPRKAPGMQAPYLELATRRDQLRNLYPDAAAQIDSERAALATDQGNRSEAQTGIDALTKAMNPTNAAPGLNEALVSGIASFGDMAPGMVSSLITRNPLPMLAYLGAYSRGSTYADKRQEGYTPEKARSVASLYAMAETIPEILPLGIILKDGGSALLKIGGGAATEAASEVLTQGLQQMVDIGLLKEDMTWGQAIEEMQKAGAAGGVMGALMGAGGVTADQIGRLREDKRGTPADPRAVPPAVPPAPQVPGPQGQGPTPAVPPAVPSAAPAAMPSPAVDPLAAAMLPAQDVAPTMPPVPANLPTPSGEPAGGGITSSPPVAPNLPTPQAGTDPGDFEIMDETETVNGETRLTGRKVRVNLKTGQASVVEANEAAAVETPPVASAPATPPVNQPQAPDAGAGAGSIPPAVDSAPAVEGSKAPESEPQADLLPADAPQAAMPKPQQAVEVLTERDIANIETDAKTFQYKDGGDDQGVTDRLRGVKSWEPERAGMSLVYEYADGRRVIADGHQRLGLAKRLAAEGQPIQMPVRVLREVDGISPAEARMRAALKNIAEGTGTAIDAAKVLRHTGQTPAQLNLPPNSAIVRDASGLQRLSDEAFGMVVNGVSTEQHGGIVGRLVEARDAQAGILALLNKLKPRNAFEAESITRQAAAETTTETQDSLFGTEQITANLYLERARVLDGALRRLKDDIKTFRTLTERAEAIASVGNQLVTEENQSRLDQDAKVRDYLASQANMKGPISEALSAAARDYKDTGKIGPAVGRFVDAVRRASETGSAGSDGGRAGGQAPEPAGGAKPPAESPQAEVKPAPAAQPEPDPAPAGDDLFNAMLPQQSGKSPEQIRAEAEAKVRADQSKMRKPGGNSGDAGPLFDDQPDLLDQKPAAPQEPSLSPADEVMRRRAIETADSYRQPNDDPRTAFTDLLNDMDSVGPLMADLAAASGLEARARIADAWVRKRGKAAGVEYLVALDKDGQPLAVGRGTKSNLSFTPHFQRMAADGRIAYATHNHPSSRGFSVQDITVALSFGVRVVAVGHNGNRHEMTAPLGAGSTSWEVGKGNPQLLQALTDAEKSLASAIQARIDAMSADPVAANKLVDRLNQEFHNVMSVIWHDLGIIAYNGDATASVARFIEDYNDLQTIIDTATERAAARIGRAGFDVAAPGNRGADRAPAEGTAKQGDPNGNRAPDGPAGRGERDGRVPEGQDGPVTDDFDGALDDIYGAPEPQTAPAKPDEARPAQTPRPAAKPVRSKSDIAKDLGNLFSEPRAGFREDGFDQTRYARAIPLFTEALDGIDVAALSQREVFAAMIRPLAAAGLPREAVAKMRPYFERFLADRERGMLPTQEDGDVSGPGGDLERDRGDTDPGDTMGGTDVPAAGGRSGGRSGSRGTASGGRGGRRSGGERLPGGDAAPVGTESDQDIQGDGRAGQQSADGGDRAAGGDRGEQGLPPDEAPASHAGGTARDGTQVRDRAALQRAADERAKRGIKPADEADIRASLPLLLPEQQDDVLKVERRFQKPDGHGMMITNGTGTGKTYSGGGVIKRFAQAGKTNILIVAPSQGILDHWVAAGADLGLTISKLDDTSTAGTGIVATTYANLGANGILASRDWDMVVTDESHSLSRNQAGDMTAALRNLRAITNRPADLWHKFHLQQADRWARIEALKDGSPERAAAITQFYSDRAAFIEAEGKKPRGKVLFLSATPFAYDVNTDYAEGYLFNYPADGHVGNSRQSGRNLFMVENFGYRIRYHKLTKPEAAVDSGVFERQFHEKLKREGVLSGRHLDIEPDYERRFVQTEDAEGAKIDGILDFIREKSRERTPEGQAYARLLRFVERRFNYLKRMQLLEAIKARSAQAVIDRHLALGRKIVIFHDYNQGGGFNPFRPNQGDGTAAMLAPESEAGQDEMFAQAGQEGYDLLVQARPEVEALNFAGYLPPVEELTKRYGARAAVYNGTVSNKDRAKAKADFNRDGSGVDIIIVQSAAGEAGISLHDISGDHHRVLINLGMPTRPTTALQEEGRIRREGSVSNAIFQYLTIGTTWERQAFAAKIAERSGAVENLALGNEARAIRESFIDAYNDAAPWTPGDTDGTGGKMKDRRRALVSPYDEAKTHYFGRTRTSGRRDQRDGLDFYPTPEPLAFKMVEWAGIRPYERALEPSAGDGSIARYMPDHADRTIIEPSADLLSRAQLRAVGARPVQSTFEDFHIVNKFNAIVMNPPFGSGGKTAIEHLAKAARHLKPGGRIVALIPTGPAADKRFDAWHYSDETKGLWLAADITLPAVTFERAGTTVLSRVVIFDKIDPEAREDLDASRRINMSGAQTIAEFFDRLEGIEAPARPAQTVDPTEDAEAAPAAPERPAAPVTDVGFKLGQTVHSKTGADLFVATATARVERDAYTAMLAVAKAHGGWYSAFKGRGAIPGFQFKSEAQRAAFIEDMQKPTLGMQEPAYHGSPHEFDRFSLNHIGSGEGAQVYGWGLYFAGRREVAEYYKRTLARTDLTLNGAEIPQWLTSDLSAKFHTQMTGLLADEPAARPQEVSEDEWRKAKPLLPYAVKNTLTNLRDKVRYDGDDPVSRLGVYRSTALAQFKGSVERNENPYEYIAKLGAIDWLEQRVGRTRPARLYKVEVPEVSEMLDWDARLSEQPEAVRDALTPVVDVMRKHYQSKEKALVGGVSGFLKKLTGREVIDFVQEHGPTYGFEPDGYIFTKRIDPQISHVIHEVRMESTGNRIGEGDGRSRALKDAAIRPDEYASLALRKLGIPGHRYLDGMSRDSGDGSRNYVIYDDSRIEITGFEEPDSPMFQAGTEADTSELVRRAMPALRAELDRLDLKRVRLDRAMGVDWQGAFEAGADMRIIIGASLDPMATLRHEVIHALRAMDLFTPAEWKALTLKAAQDWMTRYDIAARYPTLDTAAQIEEAIAEAYGDAIASKKVPEGSILIAAFNKIARLLRAVRNVLNGAGLQTYEDVFGRVQSGAVSGRQQDRGLAQPERRFQAARLPSRQARAHMATTMQGAAYIPDRRIWEELSRAGAPAWQRIRMGAAAAHDLVDRARIQIQDRFLPVLRAQQAVEAQAGQPLDADHNAYVAETTFSGKVGRHLYEIDEDYTKPIISIIAATNGGLTSESVGQWLYARHAQERNAHIASINPKMPDGGSGMSNAEAAQILADAANSPHAADLAEIARLIDALRERTIQLRQDAGLITPTEAGMWRNQYRFYVPLKGFAETDHSEAVLDMTGTGRRFNTKGTETQRALGRRSEAFNPLQAAITQAQEASIRAEKNRVGGTVYNLANDYPSPALWSVKTVRTKRYYNRTTGLVETRPVDPISLFMDPNEMAVKIGGVEHRVIFHDPRLARALGNVGADQMNWFVRLMSGISRWFSMTRTMLNPEFVISNAFRDMTTAQVNIHAFGKGERGDIAKAMIRNWPKALAGAWRGQANKADTTWSKHYKEFEQAGAKVSFWTLENPEAGSRDLDRRIWLASGPRAMRILKATVSPSAFFSTRDNGVLHFIERTNMAVDNAIRLAAFVEARQRGWPVHEAAALAKNLTVNFNRRGEASPTINALYTFFNAAVQGSTNIVAALATSRRVQMIAIGLVAAGFLNDLSNAYLSDEDDDEVLAYDKIPDWQSQRALHFMLGKDSGTAAAIPLPYGWNVFPYVGQQLGKISRGVKEPGEAMADTAAAIFGAFSPVNGGDFAALVTPTAGDPLLEMARNMDWRGRPIRPEYPGDDKKPDSQKYFSGASEAAKWVAEAANSLTGGTSAISGAVDVSPEYIDHAFAFVVGSAGSTFGRSVDLVAKAATGKIQDVTMNDVPFARVVVKDTYPGLDRDRYFTFRQKVEAADYAVRQSKTTGEAVPAETRSWASLGPALKQAEKMRRAGQDPYLKFNALVTRKIGVLAE